jgi:hypothetical protein
MTGLLSRIAARAVGEMPVAAPRTPSRFEPLAEELGLPEPEQAVHPSQAPSLDDPFPALSPFPSRTAPVATVAPVHTDLPATGHMPVSASPSPIAATLMRRESRPQAAPPSPGKPSSASQPAAPVVQAPAATLAPGVETAAAATGSAVRTPAGQHAPATTLKSARTSSTRPVATEPEGPPKAETAGAIEGHRPTVYPDAAPTPQPALANALTEPPRPTIEIHIGSVEVRAASAPAPSVAQPALASTSLDAFLAGDRGR